MNILAMTHFPGSVKHFSYASLSDYVHLDISVVFPSVLPLRGKTCCHKTHLSLECCITQAKYVTSDTDKARLFAHISQSIIQSGFWYKNHKDIHAKNIISIQNQKIGLKKTPVPIVKLIKWM